MAKTLEMVNPYDLIIVGLDDEEDESHELYDERIMDPIKDTLIANIRMHGVIQPITIRKKSGKMYVVDGRQRVRAARKVRDEQAEEGGFEINVPVTEHSTEGADPLRLASIIVSANEQRKDDGPMTKAVKARRLKQLGAEMDEITASFGVSDVTVKKWFTILESHPDLQQAINQGIIGTDAAYFIASKYDTAEQSKVLKEILASLPDDARITGSMAKAYVVNDGKSNATSPTEAQAGSGGDGGAPVLGESSGEGNDDDGALPPEPDPQPTRTSSGKSSGQAGIKRTWIRKALKTDAADDYDDEQLGVLEWIANGVVTNKKHWYAKFAIAADKEMKEKKKKS